MNSSPSEIQLAALFRQAASAHHSTFGDIEPEGHDWVPWYAEYLSPRLEQMLGRRFDVSALVADLRTVDAEQRADASGLPWPEFYARWFLRRLT
jgi:hypothetical protein